MDCRVQGQSRVEHVCVNPHSHRQELLLLPCQEVGQAWPRQLVGLFSQRKPARFHLAQYKLI